MPQFTISKFFSFVIFLAMMILFFFWIAGQVSDFGLFFGFRTSHTVANDVANLITSVGGVPGKATVSYKISPQVVTPEGSSVLEEIEDRFVGPVMEYDIDIGDRYVCVKSFLRTAGEDRDAATLRSTTDCASHPYSIETPTTFKTAIGSLDLKINKMIDEESKQSCIEISKDFQKAGGCKQDAS